MRNKAGMLLGKAALVVLWVPRLLIRLSLWQHDALVVPLWSAKSLLPVFYASSGSLPVSQISPRLLSTPHGNVLNSIQTAIEDHETKLNQTQCGLLENLRTPKECPTLVHRLLSRSLRPHLGFTVLSLRLSRSPFGSPCHDGLNQLLQVQGQ